MQSSPRSRPFRVVIAGGGTGGHVIPALAIGRELQDQHGAELLYIGTSRGLETKLVPAAGFPLELVRSGQLKNVSIKTRLKTFTDLPHGILRCVQLLRRFQPHAVVGVGGYASGPAILAAAMLHIPTLAYEPNAVPGLTNRIAGRFTSAAAVNFPQTTRFFRNAEVTGVPVRPEIFAIPQTPQSQIPNPNYPEIAPQTPQSQIPNPNNTPRDNALRLLITAGSQGAAIFNDLLPKIAHRLLRDFPSLTIVHQCGPRHLEATQAAYTQALQGWVPHPQDTRVPHLRDSLIVAKVGAPAHASATEAESNPTEAQRHDLPSLSPVSNLLSPIQIEPFLTDMPAHYAAADLVLARSGSTVAELCAAGRPSLLIPFPQAADDHQRKNAEVLAEAGAAEMLLQKDTTEQTLYAALQALLSDSSRRFRMAAMARSLARPGALPRIAAMVVRLAEKRA